MNEPQTIQPEGRTIQIGSQIQSLPGKLEKGTNCFGLEEIEGEDWKECVGFDGDYLVSSIGRVFSNRSKRIIYPCRRKDGYMIFGFRKDGKTKLVLHHRLIAMSFIPNPDNLPEINHIDFNPSNNSIDNLEWCSHRSNMRHSFLAGRIPIPNKSCPP